MFLNLTILPFDPGSARVFGPMKAELEKRGTPRIMPLESTALDFKSPRKKIFFLKPTFMVLRDD